MIEQFSYACTETLFLLKLGEGGVGGSKLKVRNLTILKHVCTFQTYEIKLISEIKLKLCTGSKQNMRYHAEDFPNYAKL